MINRKDRVENIARTMHELYEEYSLEENWKTQKECRLKDFDDLPEANKRVMRRMAKWVLLIEEEFKNEEEKNPIGRTRLYV